MDFILPKKIILLGLATLSVCTQIACEPPTQVRVYEAPTAESTFVSGPLAGKDSRSSALPTGGARNTRPGNTGSNAQAAAGPRRILGAIIPTPEGCYFLKATDSPERFEPLMADVLAIVQAFSIDQDSGRPSNKLPEGWVMNPRNDIAIAELVSPDATGRVKFTVTALTMPPEQEWPGYLLSNVNRWRGQLKLPDLTSETLKETLIEVPRSQASMPSYIFDAVGTGTGAMSGGGPGPSAPAAASSQSSSRPAPKPPEPQDTGSGAPSRPKLEYDLPTGWSVGQGSQFRLATLNVVAKEGRGEVTVSMATDNPQANTMMWFQQVAKEADPSKLEPMVEKAISGAQKFSVGGKQASLYEIRSSEQATAPMLLVVSLPTDTPEMHLFVKFIGENQLATSQKDNLIQFVQSIKIK